VSMAAGFRRYVRCRVRSETSQRRRANDRRLGGIIGDAEQGSRGGVRMLIVEQERIGEVLEAAHRVATAAA